MRKQLEIYKVEYEKLSRSDSQTAQNASFYLTQLTVKVHEFFSALNLFPAANSLQQLTTAVRVSQNFQRSDQTT
jgi:hypothetical protein